MPLETLRVLISGSLAYDFILQYDRPFVDQLVEPPVEQLNLGLAVSSIRREFGGCAGNIAYSLALMGLAPYLMTSAGADASDYLIRLDQLDIHREFLQMIPGALTSRSFFINDSVKSQISVFHDGAMVFTETELPNDPFELVMLAPATAAITYAHAHSALRKGMPFIFDPGPTVSFFTREELIFLIDHAVGTIMNYNEMARLRNIAGLSEQEVASRSRALIVTLSDKGSRLHQAGEEYLIPAIPVKNCTDPTGCGDAYRAGLLYGLTHNVTWRESAQLGSIIGAFCARHIGAQNHHFTMDQVQTYYEEHFGSWIL